jgi:DUF4097 and DUF4098 domain-containing protein YvlB
MMEEAKKEGLSDDEIQNKFGNPSILAQDLMDSRSADEEISNQSVDGYELLKAFPVLDAAFDVDVSLVSDDLEYRWHEKESIEVYYKNVKKIDAYDCKFDGETFSLVEKKKLGMIFGVRTKSGKFIIKVPKDTISKDMQFQFVSGNLTIDKVVTNDFALKTTSGDVTVKAIDAKDLQASTVSGNLSMRSGKASSMRLSMVSGDVKLDQMDIEDASYINTVSGDVKLTNVTSGHVDFKTVSGDCSGIEFYPKSIKLRSVSGDVNIKNKDKNRKIEVLGKKALSGTIRIQD